MELRRSNVIPSWAKVIAAEGGTPRRRQTISGQGRVTGGEARRFPAAGIGLPRVSSNTFRVAVPTPGMARSCSRVAPPRSASA